MKNIFIAITFFKNDKYYSYVIKHYVNGGNNLLSTLNIKNIVNATVFPTLRQAKYTVTRWNAVYKANNQYLFDDELLF